MPSAKACFNQDGMTEKWNPGAFQVPAFKLQHPVDRLPRGKVWLLCRVMTRCGEDVVQYLSLYEGGVCCTTD